MRFTPWEAILGGPFLEGWLQAGEIIPLEEGRKTKHHLPQLLPEGHSFPCFLVMFIILRLTGFYMVNGKISQHEAVLKRNSLISWAASGGAATHCRGKEKPKAEFSQGLLAPLQMCLPGQL